MIAAQIQPEAAPGTEDQIPVVVVDRRTVAAGVVRLSLAAARGGPLPAWSPGAHIDVILPNGATRQYSLCGRPGEATWTVMVLREEDGRGGSRYIHDELATGLHLTARGPRNNFPLRPAPRYRFLAGGIGITPLLPMLDAAEQAGTPWTLVYCGRTRESMAEATELRARHGARVHLHIDAADGVPDLSALLGHPAPGELLYACGPAPMLDALPAGGWPADAIHVERFTGLVIDTAADVAFEVELAATGRTLTVQADRSILDTVREAGVPVLSSCGEGTCGTCETPVLEGRIDHRDTLLSPEEQESDEVMMICVSRARRGCPRLVLDL